MTVAFTYTAPCPAGHPGAQWRTRPDSITDCGGIVGVECPICDPTVVVEAEPPAPAVVTAPGVVAVLRCIARKILYGGAA